MAVIPSSDNSSNSGGYIIIINGHRNLFCFYLRRRITPDNSSSTGYKANQSPSRRPVICHRQRTGSITVSYSDIVRGKRTQYPLIQAGITLNHCSVFNSQILYAPSIYRGKKPVSLLSRRLQVPNHMMITI